MRISVVIPVLDEAARMARCLDAVARTAGLHEVIVVDGGSKDDTVAIASTHPALKLLRGRVLGGPRGRGRQLDAGSRLATGDVLLYLHADVQLRADTARWVHTALADRSAVAGAFRTWTVSDASRTAPWLHLADLRSRYSRLPYGDQCQFVRATELWSIGGYPTQPLMEDLELSLRLARRGRIVMVPASVRVSGRRFLAHPIRDTLLVNAFPVLYRAGASPSMLAALYEDVR